MVKTVGFGIWFYLLRFLSEMIDISVEERLLMLYCVNCGRKLEDNEKFCSQCGVPAKPASDNPINRESQRKVYFDGEIKKCPNCGEILNSFSPRCAACGYELRNAAPSNAVMELSLRIQQIEFMRGKGKGSQQITEEQLTNLITSFPIPNTKEDILEFMILALSNMSNSNSTISKAWKTKVEQAYIKAKSVFGDSEEFYQIESLYNEYNKKYKKGERKSTLFALLFLLVPISFIVILIATLGIVLGIHNTKGQAEEEKRLNAIVEDVEDALSNHDYKLAMRIAESMKYGYGNSNSERERWWKIKKESLIDEIMEESEKAGVKLERPTEAPTEQD